MEEIKLFIDYISKYGIIVLFVIVYLEYLNLPGLPSGIIMPAGGILIARSEMNFLNALSLTIIAGLLGSYTLYWIGYYFGNAMLDKCYNKYQKIRPAVDKTMYYIDRYGDKGILLSRLIPVARTLISLVAGTTRRNFAVFTLYSTIGIAGWNFAFIFTGYIIGKAI